MKDLHKFRMAAFFMAIWAASGAVAQAAAVEDPQVIAQNVYAQIKDHLNVDLSNTLVNQYFDTHSMAVQALGHSYGSLSSDQRAAYVQAFDAYFKNALYHFLTAQRDARFSDLSSRIEGDRAIARCVLTPVHGGAIELAFKLILGKDSWKASDVMVDNVSLILGYRAQFRSLYTQGGFDGLVAYLNNH